MLEKRLLLKANRIQLELVVTVQINVFSFYGGTTLRYFYAICDASYAFGPPFVQTVVLGCRGRPNVIFVFGPRNDDFYIFWRFIFRPKNPRKTAVNAMNWRTNEMLKSEYFADVRGFNCNKQQAACLCMWAISDISRWPIHGNHTA